MIDSKELNQVVRQVQEVLSKSIRNFSEDIGIKIHQILQHHFTQVDLISREEFNAQTQLILRLRERLTQIELRLVKLENSNKNDLLTHSAIQSKQ